MSLRDDLHDNLERWHPPDPEAAFQRAAWRALAADEKVLSRDAQPAHFTASALPMTPDGEQVCLVLHRLVGLWLQPGGHLETSDRSMSEAAAREVEEETGLIGRMQPVPLRLSRHPAPCRPGAWHLDVQFLALCEPRLPRVSVESRDVAWFPIGALPAGMASGVGELVEAGRERLIRIGCPAPPPPVG